MPYMLLDPWHLEEFNSHSRNFINFWTIACPVFSYSHRSSSYKERLGRTKQYKGYFVVSLLSFFVCSLQKHFPCFLSLYLLLSIAALVLSLAKQCPLLYVPNNNTFSLKIPTWMMPKLFSWFASSHVLQIKECLTQLSGHSNGYKCLEQRTRILMGRESHHLQSPFKWIITFLLLELIWTIN